MDTIIIIAFAILWTLYYFLEGSHDGYVILQILGRNLNDQDLDNKYSKAWHNYSTLQHMLLHLVIPTLIATSFWQYLILVNISVALRTLFHDHFIMTTRFGLKKALTIYPTFDYKGDWYDGVLVYLRSKGITQYALKSAYVIISLILA